MSSKNDDRTCQNRDHSMILVVCVFLISAVTAIMGIVLLLNTTSLPLMVAGVFVFALDGVATAEWVKFF